MNDRMNDTMKTTNGGTTEGLRPSTPSGAVGPCTPLKKHEKKIGLLLLVTLLFCVPAALAAPLRVVSLYPGHTDNVAALGGGELLVGVSENDDPDLFPNLPRFSPKAGAESILAAKPDVVLLRGQVERMNPNLSGVLARAGVRVEVLDPPGWDGFADYLRALAGVLGLDPEAGVRRLETLRAEIMSEAESKRAGRPAPRVFVEATARELHTCAPDSWAARLVALAGGENAAAGAAPLRAGSALAPWGLERVLGAADGGLDVYLVQHGAMNASSAEDVRRRPWAGALSRVRVAEVPESWLSRPSLLGLERGGRALIRIFYGK